MKRWVNTPAGIAWRARNIEKYHANPELRKHKKLQGYLRALKPEARYGIWKAQAKNRGYIFKNIVSCCTPCNWMKRTWSQEFFLNQCRLIAKEHPHG